LTTIPVLLWLVTTMLLGQIKTGRVLSTTLIVNVQLADWLQSSLAEQVTRVIPAGNSEPLGGVQVIITLAEQKFRGVAA
jgi:hypothetical protein